MRVSPEDLAVLEEFISVRPDRKTPWWAMMLDALVRDLVDAHKEIEAFGARNVQLFDENVRLREEVANLEQAMKFSKSMISSEKEKNRP